MHAGYDVVHNVFSLLKWTSNDYPMSLFHFQGDSGSPLACRLDGIEYVVGLVSFGHGCASNNPSVYTRVSQYIGWVEENVWPIRKN